MPPTPRTALGVARRDGATICVRRADSLSANAMFAPRPVRAVRELVCCSLGLGRLAGIASTLGSDRFCHLSIACVNVLAGGISGHHFGVRFHISWTFCFCFSFSPSFLCQNMVALLHGC